MGIFSLFDPKAKVKPDVKISKIEEEERRELVDFVKESYLNHPIKGEELLNRAYYKAWVDGYHYMTPSIVQNKLIKEVPMGDDRHRSKINFTGRNLNIAVAKVLKDAPVLIAVPMGTEMKDIKTARISNAVFENAFAQNEVDLTGKTFDVEKIAYQDGTGWMKIQWNPLLRGGKGDYQITVHDDFEIYPDPSARDWWSMEWCIHAYLQDVVKLESIYSNLKGKIQPWHNDENAQSRNLYTRDWYANNPKTYQGKAFVLEFVARPSAKWPKGKKLILINLQILAKYGPNPLAVKGFGDYFSMNFVPFVWESQVGKLHGRSGVIDQIPLNKEINKICSMTMENIKKTAAMKLFLPQGTQKGQNFVAPKNHIVYFNPDQGGKPMHVDPPSMPSYVPNHLAFLVGTQQDMAGIHEVSMGQLPERGSQMSGSALKLLQDSEMVQHSPTMRRLKGSLGIVGQMILLFVQKYYTEPRVLTLTGEHKRHEVVEFMGADLNGAVSVKLQIGSAFNTSASAKIEGILSLYKEGVLQEAEKGSKAARKVLASLEFGQVDEIYQMESLYEARAQWVIDIMINERRVPDLFDWENHDVHIQALQEYMLNPDFQEKDDELKAIFNTQMNYHIQKKQEQASGKPPTAPVQPPPQADGSPMPLQAAESNMMMAEGPGAQAGPESIQFPEEGVNA